jgi:two-component system sensor histidine kinase PrrB
MKIRTRFALAGALSTVVVLTLAGAVIVRQSTLELQRNFDTDLQARFQAAAPLIASTPSRERLIDTLSANSTEVGIRVVRDGQETRIGDMPLHPVESVDRRIVTVEEDGHRWRTYGGAIPVDASVSRTPVSVQMFAPTTKLDERIAFIRRRVGAVLASSMIIAAFGSWMAGSVATSPLRKLAGAVRDYRGGRVPDAQGVDEVDAVGKTINELVLRLQQEHEHTKAALQTARDFSWNAMHELRTPLMSLRTDIDALQGNAQVDDAMRQTLHDNILRQHGRVNATLTALHDLARGELQTPDTMAEFDLSEVVESVCVGLQSLHPEMEMELVLPDHQVMRGWAEGIEIAVRNLVFNAIRYGRGVVRVTVNDAGEVVVEDNGPGIAVSDRERVFERFERATTSVPGSGLGLALVKQQAELHGGDVVVAASDLGGARFVLTWA